MAIHDHSFTLAQLAKISPWAFEQLAEIDRGEIDSVMHSVSGNGEAAQPMFVWMRTVERCHSVLWRALDAQG